MQIYMKEGHKDIMVKIDNADDRYRYTLPELDANGKETGELVAHSHFVFELEHDGSGGYQVVIYYDDDRAKMYNISASEGAVVKNFDRLYYSLPKGIRVKVKVDKLISEGLFVGCTNLTEIKVDENNLVFKSCDDGVLYDKNGYYVMRIPEGGTKHYEIPSKVVKLYAGAVHGVNADIVLHSNPQIGVVTGHEKDVENAKFYLSLDDIDNTITEKETGFGGARDFNSANTNTYVKAIYKRAPLGLTKGDEIKAKYGTIMLPFVPKGGAMEKYDFYQLKRGDATTLTFSRINAEDFEPNKPYLYKLKDTEVEKLMSGEVEPVSEGEEATNDEFESEDEVTVTIEYKDKYYPVKDDAAEEGTWQAVGSYINYYVDTKDFEKSVYYYYSISQEKFLRVTQKLNYRPFRAFFVTTPEKQEEVSNAPAKLSLRILEDDGSTTEIDPSQIEGMEEEVYYDLQGRRVLNPSNGIYIVNGKKVVIK